MRDRVPVIVRLRAEADLDRCEQLARVVHDLDGYPTYLPGDLRSFLVTSDAIAAWVAEIDGDVVGHVALHRRSSDAVMTLASQRTGQPPEELGIVARLLVDPAARRQGIARALLRTATVHAVDNGLRPILDVSTHYAAAISLYDNCGWERAGTVTLRFADGTTLDEYVYIAPPADRAPKETLQKRLAARLQSLEGVVESPSMFGPGNAFWCNGKEIAHFDAADVVDLRLTRSVIRELRPILRDDRRVELRKASSDWIRVYVSSSDDIAFVVELAERAAAAHRAGPGETPKPPPVGSDVERRRRFH